MLRKTFLIVAVVLVLAEATVVNPCNNAKALKSIQEVEITNCNVPPCKLKRNTTVAIQQKFVPNRDVETLVTSVHATVLGLPLPFIGVDGTNACNQIYTVDNVNVGCPLKAGTEYLYKNSFPIMNFYPKLSVTVYWALVENGNLITCFEVPSKITS